MDYSSRKSWALSSVVHLLDLGATGVTENLRAMEREQCYVFIQGHSRASRGSCHVTSIMPGVGRWMSMVEPQFLPRESTPVQCDFSCYL